MDAFSRDLGTEQGRIQPREVAAPAGTYVFCLGFDQPGHFETLNITDYSEVAQTATFQAGTKLLRATLIIRPPAATPTGAKWRVSLLLDGAEIISQVLAAGGRTRKRHFAANVSKVAPGDHTLAFRLALEAA